MSTWRRGFEARLQSRNQLENSTPRPHKFQSWSPRPSPRKSLQCPCVRARRRRNPGREDLWYRLLSKLNVVHFATIRGFGFTRVSRVRGTDTNLKQTSRTIGDPPISTAKTPTDIEPPGDEGEVGWSVRTNARSRTGIFQLLATVMSLESWSPLDFGQPLRAYWDDVVMCSRNLETVLVDTAEPTIAEPDLSLATVPGNDTLSAAEFGTLRRHGLFVRRSILCRRRRE
jgi:hypothetical protein